jgi:Fe-S cluster assembly protein SufD
LAELTVNGADAESAVKDAPTAAEAVRAGIVGEVSGVATAGTGIDFASFVEGLDESETLTSRRTAAWKRYAELPFPTKKSEEWRYTDLSKIDFDGLAAAPARGHEDALPARVEGVLESSGARAGVVVLRNGRVVHAELDPSLAEKGVVVCTIAEAAADHPEWLERTLFAARPAAHEEKLWALHTAFMGGYVLYVPRNVEIEAPLHAFHVVDGEGTLAASHTVIVAETGSVSAVIDEFVSDDLAERSVSVHGATVHGEDNADVEYVALQRFGRGVAHFATQHVSVRRDTRIKSFNVALGGDVSRADVTSRLLGPGSDSEMLALWFGGSDQHFDHHTLQHHAAPHAHSDLLFKGALTDDADSVFRGVIRVDKGAQLTDAYQTNRNLLLSEGSHATSLPNLEIEADDVKCSHGATIGQVDEGQLFYLQARGLTREQAERLLVFGFFEEVLGRIPMKGVRDRVMTAIEEKIGL